MWQFNASTTDSVDENIFFNEFYRNQTLRNAVIDAIRTNQNIKIYGVLRTFYEDIGDE